MPLSFPFPPKWLQTPSVDPAVHSIATGNPGPYEWAGKLYWIYDEFTTGSSNGVIVAYRSNDRGQTQPMTRIPSGGITVHGDDLSVSWPGTGSVIYISFKVLVSTTIHIKATTFDMATETFGAILDTGATVPLAHNSANTIPILRSNGDLVVGYDDNGTVFAVIYHGGSWSAPITVGTGTHPAPLIGGDPISSGNVSIWWSDGTNIQFCVLAGSTPTNTVVTSQTDIITNDPFKTQQLPFATIYDPVSDSAAWVFLKITGPTGVYVAVASPSSSPVPVVNFIYSDPVDFYEFLNPTLAGNLAGNSFVILLWSVTFDSQLQILQGTSLTGAWVGPSVYYNAVTNSPSPPPAHTFNVFPSFSRFLSDGTLANTSNFIPPAGSTGDTVDTPAAMISAVVIVVTCPIGNAGVGIAYTGTIAASGGTAPYTFAITAGSLPPGLTLDTTTGIITGTPLPTTTASFSFTVQVTDSLGTTATATCSIAITPITTQSAGGRGFVRVVLNAFDSCLGREYLLYKQIDRELLKCGVKPFCFCFDERDWGGNFSEHEEVPMGPPEGALAFNPTGQLLLPTTASGDNTIFSFRMPIGYDGVILGQYHGYIPSPTAFPVPNFVEGSGDIVWRLEAASRCMRDCGLMKVSIGSLQNMSPVAGGLQVMSGNLVEYVVSVPNTSGTLVPGIGYIVAGIHGWMWPRK